MNHSGSPAMPNDQPIAASTPTHVSPGTMRAAGAAARRRRKRGPMGAVALLASIAAVFFAAEALIMFAMPLLGELPPWVEALVDAGSLTLICTPIIYVWLLRPAYSALEHRTHELELQKFALDAAAIVDVTDAAGLIIYVNDRFCQISGYTRDELLGRDHRLIDSGVHPKEFFGDAYRTLERGDVWRAEVCNRAKDGSLYWVDTTIIPSRDASGRISRYTAIRFDVTARKQIEEANVAAQAAARASEAKTRFLSHMSHELRTPMNAILGFTQLLAGDRTLDAEQARKLQHIQRAGEHMVAMINDLLDFSRIEDGRLSLSLEPIPVCEVAREALAIVSKMADDVGVELRCGTDPQAALFVRADRVRLRQVLTNLLSNAIKYNHRGGRVTVSATLRDGEVALAITDTGRGLKPAQVEHLFEPFNRLGADRSPIEGTGLGLVITRRLVDMMGGRIGVTSMAEKGSCFTVWLPAAAPSKEAPSVATAAPQAANPAERTVLYVEDNETNVLLVEAIVQLQPGWRLRVARSGAAALEAVRRERPDVILLDLHLGDMTGLEVFGQLQTDPATRATPCLMLSADALPAQIEAARRAGIRDYLTKPVDCDRLVEAIARALVADEPSAAVQVG
ncbi:MAG: PAS domain-containing hybrid sensor histidine kinase/response regulator [Pseudomonadota bacterium]